MLGVSTGLFATPNNIIVTHVVTNSLHVSELNINQFKKFF